MFKIPSGIKQTNRSRIWADRILTDKETSKRRKRLSEYKNCTYKIIMLLLCFRGLITNIFSLNTNADIYQISDTHKRGVGLTGTKKGATDS